MTAVHADCFAGLHYTISTLVQVYFACSVASPALVFPSSKNSVDPAGPVAPVHPAAVLSMLPQSQQNSAQGGMRYMPSRQHVGIAIAAAAVIWLHFPDPAMTMMMPSGNSPEHAAASFAGLPAAAQPEALAPLL